MCQSSYQNISLSKPFLEQTSPFSYVKLVILLAIISIILKIALVCYAPLFKPHLTHSLSHFLLHTTTNNNTPRPSPPFSLLHTVQYQTQVVLATHHNTNHLCNFAHQQPLIKIEKVHPQANRTFYKVSIINFFLFAFPPPIFFLFFEFACSYPSTVHYPGFSSLSFTSISPSFIIHISYSISRRTCTTTVLYSCIFPTSIVIPTHALIVIITTFVVNCFSTRLSKIHHLSNS